MISLLLLLALIFPPFKSCSSIPLLLSESKFWRSIWEICVKITQEHGGNYVTGQMPPTNKNLLTLFPEKNPQLEPDISSTYLRNKGELPLLHRRHCPLLLKFCNTMPLLDIALDRYLYSKMWYLLSSIPDIIQHSLDKLKERKTCSFLPALSNSGKFTI